MPADSAEPHQGTGTCTQLNVVLHSFGTTAITHDRLRRNSCTWQAQPSTYMPPGLVEGREKDKAGPLAMPAWMNGVHLLSFCKAQDALYVQVARNRGHVCCAHLHSCGLSAA